MTRGMRGLSPEHLIPAPDMDNNHSTNAPCVRPRQTAIYTMQECRECCDDENPCDGKFAPLLKCLRCATLGYRCLPPRAEDETKECITCRIEFVPINDTQLTCLRCLDWEGTHDSPHDEPRDCVDVESYAEPFISFISDNPTSFHAVSWVGQRLESYGFTKLLERDSWTSKLSRGGRYFFERNGSSVIAFVVGGQYKPGNGASIIASHIDALTTRLKPISTLSTKAGYIQLGIAPYAGALNSTWWDRDLGIGGRVLVRNSKTGKIETRLVKLGWPIARIPTLAPHFGAAADISNPNRETQMVPIIGLDNEGGSSGSHGNASLLGGAGAFTATQPERLVKAIAGELNIRDCK